MDRTGRELLWWHIGDDPGLEQARLVETETGPEISGLVLLAQNGSPLRVDYRIACDPSWLTRTVRIDQTWRGIRRSLRLHSDGSGHWQRDGREDRALSGCTDVDLGVTPSTNALPINRLRLPLGETGEIHAAWIRFPELDIISVCQSYHRLTESRYQYKNLLSGFTALVDVDGDGMPTEYAGFWRRVAEGAAAPGKWLYDSDVK